MAKSRRKHILNAGLKALIAGAETFTGLKMAATFISELAALPEDKQKELGGLSQEKFNQWVAEETRDIVKDINKKVDMLLEKHKAELKEERLKIQTAKLPVTGKDLFGREEEIKLLDEAWEAEHTHIVSLVAWGGVGKSALVNEWLNRMEAGNWRGAERVYGWSFYSQGTKEKGQASGDTFLTDALEWFGDKEMAESKQSPWDKGVRLAELVREQRTLLILDGMEPLQYPPGAMEGQLKDKGVQALLKEISRSNNGLCVISTRENVADIENTVDKTTKRVWLENLSEEAGAQVLENLGVKGTKEELLDTSREFKGHALALNLLGSYLATVHDGEIRKKDLVPGLEEEEEKGGHAKRVMESYEIWLKGKAELDILYLMGLFDRPADKGAIEVLRKKPAIKGLTENIAKLSEAKWKFAVKHLRDLRLLAEEDENELGKLDCHPLIREHFEEKLKCLNPFTWKQFHKKLYTHLLSLFGKPSHAWREAHGRLYEYYRDLPEKERPDTLEEMEPLFAAVAHGCAAGRHQEALDNVYYRRIQRDGRTNYCCRKLGAFGADLAAMASFFEECWSKPAAGLTDENKAGVLNWAGFRLRAVGRLREAAEPNKASLDFAIKNERWKLAAIASGNLSELYLTLGELDEAVNYGRRSVVFADKSGDGFRRYVDRATLAYALHQTGKVKEAEELFCEAEQLQKQDEPGYEYLYSLRGYQFCDLLLGQGKYKEVQKRADLITKIGEDYSVLLDIGLGKVLLGWAYMDEVIAEGKGNFEKAREYLEKAVDGLRKAGQQHYLPRGLLGRAEVFHHTGEFKDAWRDVEEARETAERGEMKRWMADCALEACRLNVTQKQKGKAKEELKRAKELIKECGYHRRDKEVEQLKIEI